MRQRVGEVQLEAVPHHSSAVFDIPIGARFSQASLKNLDRCPIAGLAGRPILRRATLRRVILILAPQKPQTLSVLLVEDDPEDALLVGDMLAWDASAEFELSRVERLADARRQLVESPVESVLLDLSLPDARGLEALTELREVAPEVPIVILSGLDDELLAVEAVRGGAQDYLIKGRADGHLISRSIRYAVERKQAENELNHEAVHDSLTGLPNRALFLDRLDQALARSRRQPRPFAVLFVDLNGFKLINDSLGHAVGDQVLVAVAGRLRDTMRESDTAARFGGDEFTILCEDVDDESHAERIVDRISRELEPPFVFEGRPLFVTASIGIAFVVPPIHHDGETLIRAADAAMYRAKERGAPYELSSNGVHG
jgi:diguanylate cyclase (GGDEF)-like protein